MTAERRISWVVVGLFAVNTVLTAGAVEANAPGHIATAFFHADAASLPDLLIRQVFLPRVLVALVAGAAFAGAAYLLQQVLQNPLASPTTFGISGGATFVVASTTLILPSLQRLPASLGGAALGAAVAATLASRRRFTPIALTVAGLFVALLFGVGTTALYILQGRTLGGLAIWGTGSLDGAGWSALNTLCITAGIGLVLLPIALRPLALLQLDDRTARGLGLSVATTRLLTIVLVIWLCGTTVATVGGIGFVDLAAVACVRFARVRRFSAIWTVLVGAEMLWFVDEAAQCLSFASSILLPTGSLAGLLGAPVMVLAASYAPGPAANRAAVPRWRQARAASPHVAIFALLSALAAAIVVSLAFGRAPHGWHWAIGEDFAKLFYWRAPRVGASLAAGVLLALAGGIVQRLASNPMASPEILGVSTGAAFANVVLLALWPESPRLVLLAVGALASILLLAILLRLGRRRSFDPSAFLLAGVGLSAMLGTVTNLVLALGLPDSGRILSWLGGSTYGVAPSDAVIAGVAAVSGLAIIPLITRWLDLLPLGETSASALGVDASAARFSLILTASVLTAAGTLFIGPFAFIGLMAPHLATLCGARRPMWQLPVAAAFGALILITSDFLGRNLLFPYQLPAGTVATMLGMGPMIWLLLR